ncbi:MAG: hypothetical protein ACRDP6_05460 [Actinoallomurus sp.]
MIHHLVAALISDGGHHHDGNGRHNRTIVSVRSPTNNRGYQHTTNSNAGGTNPVQNALCRHVTVCNVTQKITMIMPERPAPEPVVIQALPQTVIQQSRPRAAPPIRSPFMYMGPSGFLFAAPDSGGFGFGFG